MSSYAFKPLLRNKKEFLVSCIVLVLSFGLCPIVSQNTKTSVSKYVSDNYVKQVQWVREFGDGP